jgi:hypothetical protein
MYINAFFLCRCIIVKPILKSMAEEEKKENVPEQKTKRQLWIEKFTDYPLEEGQTFDDDEIFFSALDKYDEDRTNRINSFEESNKRLTDAFINNPKAAMLLSSLADGSDVLTAIAESFGPDIKDALENDPEARKKYDEGIQAYQKNKSELEEIERKQEENAQKFSTVIEDFIVEKEMDESTQSQFKEYISNLLDSLVTWEFSKDVLERLWRGMTYDEATEEAEIRGRNAKIELEKKRANEATDKTPMIEQGANDIPSVSREKISVWDINDNRKKSSIWDK